MSRGEMTTVCSLELTRARVLWEDDQANGRGGVFLPDALERKYPSRRLVLAASAKRTVPTDSNCRERQFGSGAES